MQDVIEFYIDKIFGGLLSKMNSWNIVSGVSLLAFMAVIIIIAIIINNLVRKGKA